MSCFPKWATAKIRYWLPENSLTAEVILSNITAKHLLVEICIFTALHHRKPNIFVASTDGCTELTMSTCHGDLWGIEMSGLSVFSDILKITPMVPNLGVGTAQEALWCLMMIKGINKTCKLNNLSDIWGKTSLGSWRKQYQGLKSRYCFIFRVAKPKNVGNKWTKQMIIKVIISWNNTTVLSF